MTRKQKQKNQAGLSLVELLISMTLLSMIVVLMSQLVVSALDSWGDSSSRSGNGSSKEKLLKEGSRAMNRMVNRVRETSLVLIPLKISDPSDPDYPDSRCFPRTILAVSGMIDNDGDGLIDEDPGADITGDGAAGIIGVDDNDDGFTDTYMWGGLEYRLDVKDDDEDTWQGEDWVNGMDDDAPPDHAIDEDPGAKYYGQNPNDDAASGDIASNEDPFDPLIYFLDGTDLWEQQNEIKDTAVVPPVMVDPPQKIVLARHVTEFEVLRRRVNGNTLIDIHLVLNNGRDRIELNTTVYAYKRIKL